jgi:hypothetical protein
VRVEVEAVGVGEAGEPVEDFAVLVHVAVAGVDCGAVGLVAAAVGAWAGAILAGLLILVYNDGVGALTGGNIVSQDARFWIVAAGAGAGAFLGWAVFEYARSGRKP